MPEHILFAFVRSTLRASLQPRYAITGPMVRLLQTSCTNHERDDGCDDPPKPPPMKKSYYALGALIIGTGAMVAYAKYDEDFRRFLTDNAPMADEFVSFITAEEVSQVDYIVRILMKYKDIIVDDLAELINKQLGHDELRKKRVKGKVCEDTGKPFRAPPSAFVDLSFGCVDVAKDKYEEARTSLKHNGVEEIKKVIDSDYKDKKKKEMSTSQNQLSPNTLMNLENEINKSAEAAIRAYIMAGCFLREFTEDVCRLLSVSVEKADQKLWTEVRKKGEERNNYIEKAESSAKQAEEKLKDLQQKLDEPDLPGGEAARSITKRNIQKILKQLEESKKDYENERNNATVIEKLWTKVLEARSHFLDDIETLNPTFRLTDKELKLPDAEMNIFIHNALMVALHLQTDFLKVDTVGKMKLRSAVELSRIGNPEAVESAIELELEKEKRKISMEYYKKLLTVKAECEQTTKQAIADQGISFEDDLEKALATKEAEVMRKLQREFDEKLMEEKEKQREEMAAVLGRLKGMDDLMKERACEDHKSKNMWSATEALQAAVTGKRDCVKMPLKPLDMEIKAIKNLISDDDEFTQNVLEAVPRLAIDRGVYTVPALKERFGNVYRVARKVGFLPDGGATLPVMLVQMLKAILIVNPSNPIPCHELMNEPFDAESLDNFEILQRAKFYVDKGDWYMVLGYLNLLKGASAAVARDFNNELKLYLEMKLIADALVFNSSVEYLAF